MKFEYAPVRSIQGQILHKVLREDGLQMGNFGTEGSALYMAAYLNEQVERKVGNAHKLRNDAASYTQQHKVRGLYVVAYSMDDHGDHIVYHEVKRVFYPLPWIHRRRAVVFKNFARNFHPRQRRKLTFCVEYAK